MSIVPFRKRVQRYINESLETLFGTTEFSVAVRRLLAKSTTGVSEFTGKAGGFARGDEYTIWEGKASSVRGIYVMSAVNATTDFGFKTVQFSVSPPATTSPTAPGDNALGMSYTGGSGDAQFESSYNVDTDMLRVYFVNITTPNPAQVFDLSFKVTIFHK